MWNCFIENSKKCNVPNFDLIIDELFPCKTRYPFIPYMTNKPDKFGIKFWLLADAQSKYLCYGKPCLGRDPSRSRCKDLLGDVCLTLLQPYYIKSYNLITDNYFASLKLAEELKQVCFNGVDSGFLYKIVNLGVLTPGCAREILGYSSNFFLTGPTKIFKNSLCLLDASVYSLLVDFFWRLTLRKRLFCPFLSRKTIYFLMLCSLRFFST